MADDERDDGHRSRRNFRGGCGVVRAVKKAALALIPVVTLLAAGCLGNSSARVSASAPATPPPSSARQGLSIGPHPVVDRRTRQRLLAEWRVAVSTAQEMYGPAGGIAFLPPQPLASALRRANPAIPIVAVTAGAGPKSSLVRDVFVVPTGNVQRLDIATVAADGSYVHLVAVDRHAPRFKFGSLLRGGL